MNYFKDFDKYLAPYYLFEYKVEILSMLSFCKIYKTV